MPMNGPSSISTPSQALGKENKLPGQSRRLSRSPHPYHRGKRFLSSLTPINATAPSRTDASEHTRALDPLNGDRSDGTSYFDADSRARRKSITSPSDSGTEADDESGSVLRGLPAPPIKQRKGLKAPSGTSSPLLTPSYLDDESRRLGLERQARRRKSLQSPTITDDETLKIREKFTRRRRAELLRRVTETILLGSVGYIACGSVPKVLLRTWSKGTSTIAITEKTELIYQLAELFTYGSLVSSIYLSYPFRLFYYNRTRANNRGQARRGIRIPAAFDPAPLLYPVLVPVLVALSLVAVSPRTLLFNIVLSISSMPRKVIPFSEILPGYSSMQWLLSTLPLALSHGKNETTGDLEILVLLYPLHQSLMPCLGYLTTTSLLPAELQLLSNSMINIFVLATSPQAIILKALLWIGGLSIFILCGTVLKWEVALARIPSWRFRHPRRRSRKGFVLLNALDDYWKGRLHNWGIVSGPRKASDSDDPNNITVSTRRSKRHSKLKLIMGKEGTANVCFPSTTPLSAIDCGAPLVVSNANEILENFKASSRSQRRHTLPSYMGVPPGCPSQETGKDVRRMKLPLTKPRSFLSLTEAQATVVKWLNALYVYCVVLITIIVSIRIYVSRFALQGQEPVGWALGYLFGDIPLFRIYTAKLGLDNWICLPPEFDRVLSWAHIGTADKIRLVLLGAANTRLLICAYYVGIIAVGLAVVIRLSASVEVDTRRKVFHGTMVAMLLPTVFIDPTFAALALILALAIFLLLDLFRASQLPPVSKPLTYFLAPYVDGRDHRGPVIVSHIFLLIGCAIPLWLSLAAIERTAEGWDVSNRDLGMISGVVCVGMGDAAASLIGRRYGRRRWCWSGGKSFEGSLAFAVAVVLGLAMARLWLLLGGWAGDSHDPWPLTLGKAAVAATGASLTEAVLTGGNDNVIVPIILWLLVRGLRM